MPNSSDLVDLLPERTSLEGIGTLAEAEVTGFNLYREATILVTITGCAYYGSRAAEFPLERNQAILSGLLIRLSKFMRVITLLASERSDAEVIGALTRCVMETAINLEYLVTRTDVAVFDAFVESSLGPERELYDIIQGNVAARGGEYLPIENRMIASLDRVCRGSGKTIEQIDKRRGQWGINFRERLKAVDKEELYLSLQRIGSHAIHGTWVDLMTSHLHEDPATGTYRVRNKKRPDARMLSPSAYLILDSLAAYVTILWNGIPETVPLSEAITDLQSRLLEFESIHEAFLQQHPKTSP